MLKKDGIKLIILIFILMIFSLVYAIIMGRTYKLNTDFETDNIDNVRIEVVELKGTNSFKIVSTKIVDVKISFKLKSMNRGKAYINIDGDNSSTCYLVYVHSFGIITLDRFLGDSDGDLLFQISSIVIMVSLIAYLIKKYKESRDRNFYNYKNIVYIGTIIFFSFSLIDQILKLMRYHNVYDIISGVVNSAILLSMLVLPVIIIVSLLVITSSVVLIRKEGFTWKNMLGVFLGLAIIVLTFLPDQLYQFLTYHNIVDIHNEQGIFTYIEKFLESSIAIINAYLECILVSTIILSVKAARYIPKFNKDYIIILGCMIKKDGSLTPLLKSRVDRAIEFSKMQKDNANKDITFVVSGGKGSDEPISEAEAMKEYLISKGINANKIIVENKSKSTYENIKYSYELISKKKKDAKLAVSTTNYHVFRAGVIADEQGIHVGGIGAKTKAYFWINAFIREFIATLYTERKSHLKMILFILAVVFILVSSLYVSNII